MNVDPMQLIKMIKNGQNPQQLIMSIFNQNNNNNNPILQNAMNLAKNGNAAALEIIARNLAEQKGLDFDTQFTNFKNQLYS